jgi:hypothetical protein
MTQVVFPPKYIVGIQYTEMTELISLWFKHRHNLEATGKEIWHHDPQGELFRVFEWYAEALQDAEFMTNNKQAKAMRERWLANGAKEISE